MNIEQMATNKNEIFSNMDRETRISPISESPTEIGEFPELRKDKLEILKPNISYIENTSLSALFEQNRALEAKSIASSENGNEADEKKRDTLTEEEKAKVKEETGWPDEIINALGSMAEYEIYKKAGLQAAEVNGKWCLIRSDIDMNQTDSKGRTNRERMDQGLAPLAENGKPIELHHIGQHKDSPLAELTFEEHHCDGNDTILHDKSKETEVHKEGNNWKQEREDHWESRTNNK